MLITSTANPSVKAVRALRTRKSREATGLYFVEGLRIVGEAVALGADVETCIVAPELLTSQYGWDLIGKLRVTQVLEVSADVFRSLSTKEGPQGIGAVVRQRWEKLGEIDPDGDMCWTALAGAQDPGNVGTILRTSDAVGGSGVLLVGASTDPYDPQAVRASMGAILSQRMVRATFDELVSWSRQQDCMLVGTSDAAPTDYRTVEYRSPTILLMGSEREGLMVEQQTACDVVASIPMVGRSDSLNLAVATGVMLYEVFRQRG